MRGCRPECRLPTQVQFLSMAAAVVFLTTFDVYLGRLERLPIPPFVLFILLTTPAIFFAWSYLPRLVRHSIFETRRPVAAMCALAVVSLLLGLGGLVRNEVTPKLVLICTLDAYVFLAGIQLVVLCRNHHMWKCGMLFALLAIVGSIIVDTVRPGTFNQGSFRASGIAMNPNTGAVLTVFFTISTLRWTRSFFGVRDILILAFGFVGVFLTFSRSGIALYTLTATYYLWHGIRNRHASAIVMLIGVGFCGFLFVPTTVKLAQEMILVPERASARVEAFFGNVHAMDHGGDVRWALAREALEWVRVRPLMGWGTGFSYANEIDPMRWLDNGILGLFIYIWWLAENLWLHLRYRNPAGLAIIFVMALCSLSSHNILDNKGAILLLGLMAGRVVLQGLSETNKRGESASPPRAQRHPMHRSTRQRGILVGP